MSATFMGSDASMAKDFTDTPTTAKKPVPRRRVRRSMIYIPLLPIRRPVQCDRKVAGKSEQGRYEFSLVPVVAGMSVGNEMAPGSSSS
jgi:hypothetical protein